MAAVFAAEAVVQRHLGALAGAVTVAAVNGPEHIVLAGAEAALGAAVARLQGAGIEARRLEIGLAAHSPLVDPILDAFEDVAATVCYAAPQIDLISGMTGLPVGSSTIDARYWRRHLREPVRFADAVGTLVAHGHTILVEVGPHPSLIGIARQFLPEGILTVPSLRRGQDDWDTLLGSLGALYVAGVNVDWAGFDRPYAPRRVVLPTYPFQRERHWHESLGTRGVRYAPSEADSRHLLGHPVRSPELSGPVFETRLSADRPAFLAHHRIHGVVVLPSPAFLELLLAAGAASLNGACAVTNFHIHEALVLPEEGERVVQTVLRLTGDCTDAKVFSRDEGEERWRLHAEANLVVEAAEPTESAVVDLAGLRDRCAETLDSTEFYHGLAALGLEFGESFRGLRHIHRRDGEALGMMELPDAIADEVTAYGIHPALLDSCFHLLGAALGVGQRGRTYLLIAIERFRLYSQPGRILWNHATLRQASAGSGETFGGDVRLYDEDGRLVAEVLGLQLKLASREALARVVRRQSGDLLYEVSWQPAPHTDALATSLTRPSAVAAQVAPLLDPLAEQHSLNMYRDLLPALDELSANYAARALAQLGMSFRPGTIIELAALAGRLGVPPRHQRLLGRLLAMLGEDGVLRRAGHRWEVVHAPLQDADPETRVAELLARFPTAEAEITLTARCGPALAMVLRGEADPLQLLFPGGSLASLEQLYRHSPFALVFNRLVAEAIAGAASGIPANRSLRVLEIGAGTGATTAAALATLPLDRIDYWFTDISPLFLERARERFAGIDGLRFHLFDVERDPTEQGLGTGTFDLVIAANVIHATADVRCSLAHAHRLLAPGGLLLLLEGTRCQRWVDLTFGLTEGWWRFTDTDLRPEHPLLSRAAWTALLTELGADDPTIICYNDDSPADQALILAAAPPVPTSRPADWLILADGTGVTAALAERLRARGERVTVALTNAELTAVAEVRSDAHTKLRLLHLAGLDAPAADAAAETQLAAGVELCEAAIAAVRGLSAHGEPAELWLVTRGAQPAKSAVAAPVQAALWGLGRVVALEHPEIWGGLIDLDPAYEHAEAAVRLLAELDAPDGEDQLALRAGQRLVARLTHAEPPAAHRLALCSDASYLIVGGLGGLGLKLAHWLVESGARHLVLTGRTPLTPRERMRDTPNGSRTATQIAAIAAIEDMGASVEVVVADAGDRDQMSVLFARFGRELPPLRGIVHAAAHLGAFPLCDLPSDELRAMLRPKLGGVLLLHELSQDMQLDFFALYSSTTALWGSSRLAHYAAGNAVLDAFAHWRRAAGRPTLSVNWGTWDEMRVASEDERRVVADFGLNPLPSTLALDTLGDLLGSSAAQIAVAAVDWQRLKPAYEARRARPFLALVGTQDRLLPAAKSSPDKGITRSRLLHRLEAARPQDRHDIVAAFVQAEVARTLGADAGRAIDSQQGLFQLGMDSLMAVDLKVRLEAGIGHGLPSTVVFNHPTIDALTDYLLDEVSDAGPATPPIEPVATIASRKGSPVAKGLELDTLSEDELEVLLAERLARR
jgi:acyl transferase domain-containing protein/SAM-dependent methyltransferase